MHFPGWSRLKIRLDVSGDGHFVCRHSDADALLGFTLPAAEDTQILHEAAVVIRPLDASSFLLEQLNDPEASLLICNLDGSFRSSDIKYVHIRAHALCIA